MSNTRSNRSPKFQCQKTTSAMETLLTTFAATHFFLPALSIIGNFACATSNLRITLHLTHRRRPMCQMLFYLWEGVLNVIESWGRTHPNPACIPPPPMWSMRRSDGLTTPTRTYFGTELQNTAICRPYSHGPRKMASSLRTILFRAQRQPYKQHVSKAGKRPGQL